MDKDLLTGLYDDLYTAGKSTLKDLRKTADGVIKTADDVRKTVQNSRADKKADKTPQLNIPDPKTVTDTVNQSGDTIRDSEQILKDASSTLEEARKLFGDPALTAKQPGAPAAVAAAPAEEKKPQEPETDPMEDLDALIGLTTIKHDVKELMDFVKIQKMRKEEGLKSVPTSLHLVFTGNPGTGKTTVARIIGRLYKQIGVLSQGQLIEVDRSGLVAGYVGQTAIKTQDRIKEAMGGVLFIDEAYALAGGDQDSFGQEAINTILKAMEDNREDFVVIVAGYTEPMERFINSNPGLKSRFNKYIEFGDYTIDELEAIFYMNCRKYDYEVEEDVKHQIRALIVSRKLLNLENFANAREVRNLFEEIITNQARRIAKIENPTHEQLKSITLDDLIDTGEETLSSGEEEGDPKTEASEQEAPEVGTEKAEASETEPAEEKTSEQENVEETPAPETPDDPAEAGM